MTIGQTWGWRYSSVTSKSFLLDFSQMDIWSKFNNFWKKNPSAQGMKPHSSFEFCIFYSLQRRFAINFVRPDVLTQPLPTSHADFAMMPAVCFMQILKCLGPFPRNTLLTWQDAAEQHNHQGMSIFPEDSMIPGTSKPNLRWLVIKRESQLSAERRLRKKKTNLITHGRLSLLISALIGPKCHIHLLFEKRGSMCLSVGRFFKDTGVSMGAHLRLFCFPVTLKGFGLDASSYCWVQQWKYIFLLSQEFFLTLACKCYCSCFKAASQ